MPDIGTTVSTANLAVAVDIERAVIVGVLGVAINDLTLGGKHVAGAGVAGRQHTVEHVNPVGDGHQDILRVTNPHQVARFVLGQISNLVRQHLFHVLLTLPHRESADSVAGEIQRQNLLRRQRAKVLVNRSLDDAEQVTSLIVFGA